MFYHVKNKDLSMLRVIYYNITHKNTDEQLIQTNSYLHIYPKKPTIWCRVFKKNKILDVYVF